MPPVSCPVPWLCGYTGAAYSGTASAIRGDVNPSLPSTADYVGFHTGRSVFNNTGECAVVYNRAHYQGQSLTVRPQAGIRNLPASFGHILSIRFAMCQGR
ncbi:peptidase inhibitor family I36 protein [Peterkaempfera sp. SMS 1(5)a]|uniref:peptidase inhibitor family I36 protein n=1 Tax=Peterkaempfera podocarpi TaxID=3232308 RepID=UPI00366CA929